MTNSASPVRDNRERQRYELDVAGGLAFIDYRRKADIVTMVHAEVPADLQGRGVGSALVRGALVLAREQGERVIPLCPFVAVYMNRHPEFQNLLPVSPRAGG